jgi:hypothetical protein
MRNRLVCRFCGETIAERGELTPQQVLALKRLLGNAPNFYPDEMARLVLGLAHLIHRHPATAKAVGKRIAEFEE